MQCCRVEACIFIMTKFVASDRIMIRETDIDTTEAECDDCGTTRPREELTDKPTARLVCDECWHDT